MKEDLRPVVRPAPAPVVPHPHLKLIEILELRIGDLELRINNLETELKALALKQEAKRRIFARR